MIKLGNKGFFLAETIVVVGIVATVLVLLYAQISGFYRNYERNSKYNTVESIHAAHNIKTYIIENYTTELLNDLTVGAPIIDITNYNFDTTGYYNSLIRDLGIKFVLFSSYNINDVITNYTSYDLNASFTDYVKTLRVKDEKANTYRIIVVLNNDSYTNILMNGLSVSYEYTGSYQTFTTPLDGNYKVELWGAQGGSTKYNVDGTGADVIGGLGAYSTGEIYLSKGEVIYVYVGGKGENGGVKTGVQAKGGYNGGGDGMVGRTSEQNAGGGGGATDIRLVSGLWNNVDGLRNRIMVSAGGGGASNWSNAVSGGYGGGLIGDNGKLNIGSVSHALAAGGYQAAGGSGGGSTGGMGDNGQFGIGGNSNPSHGSGGGSGYFGGGGSGYIASGVSSAGGGSSFISGYIGCNAVNASGVNTGQPNHYLGKVFINSQMIAGNASMPTPSGGTETGHTGNGYAQITYTGQ